MAGQILQSQTKKSENQSQQYNLAKEVINIKAISTGKDKAEIGKSLMHTPLASSIFQATSVLPSATVPNSAPSFRE
ncbi:hypothetical protein WUBG_19088, partial [Wuchereria bancrofti]